MRIPKDAPGKPIPDYPMYRVLENGDVVSYWGAEPRTLTPTNSLAGNKVQVGLSKGKKDAKIMYVDRVVAAAYLENPNNYRFLTHIDGNQKNCAVDNLEWSPFKGSCYCCDVKLGNDVIVQGKSIKATATILGVNPQAFYSRVYRSSSEFEYKGYTVSIYFRKKGALLSEAMGNYRPAFGSQEHGNEDEAPS